MQRLPDIFTPSTVIGLEDIIVESVAAESDESKVERARCAGKLEILEKALSVLHRLDRHNPRKIKPHHGVKSPKLESHSGGEES